MSNETFESFKLRKLGEGFDQVLIRDWAPDFFNEPHVHPFDTEALVVDGEFWLSMNGQTSHFKKGDLFRVDRDVIHHERYGPDGAIFWAARKN